MLTEIRISSEVKRDMDETLFFDRHWDAGAGVIIFYNRVLFLFARFYIPFSSIEQPIMAPKWRIAVGCDVSALSTFDILNHTMSSSAKCLLISPLTWMLSSFNHSA